MELKNEYDVAAPTELLWDVLNDVERVAPFVPGFELQEVDGDTYRGTMKVKVGAISVSYNAEIEVLDRDAKARRVVMEVSGRERRGPGSVNAKVTSKLEPNGVGTRLALDTDVQVTGKVAQFGGGVLADVSDVLMGQFVRDLEADLGRSGAVAEAPAAEPAADASSTGGPRRVTPAPSADALDLGAVAGPVMLRRMAPAAAAVAVPLVALLAYLLGRARR